MQKILIEEKYIYEYIKDMLNSFKLNLTAVKDTLYHHNDHYENGVSIIKHGILSLNNLNRLGITNYSNEFLEIMDDIESHINGINGISLSIMGLNDLYHNEDEYNAFNLRMLDILIKDDIATTRRSTYYGNEFICDHEIKLDKFVSFDIRLLKYIDSVDCLTHVKDILEKYNHLIMISRLIKNNNIALPLREMSFDCFDIDIDKMSTTPKVFLKK